MPREFTNAIVLSLVAVGVAGLMLSTLSAIGAEGVSYAERIGLIALWVAVLFSVGRGIHGRRRGNADRWSDAQLIVGAVIALVFFALGGVYYVTVQHAPETLMMARPPITIEQAASSNLPLEMRSMTTYRLAQEEFIRRGNLVKVLDPDGQWRPYQPSPDDLAKRRKLAALLDNREAKTGTIGDLLTIGIVTLLATIVIAFLLPVRRKSN
jgi:hypothetical protein